MTTITASTNSKRITKINAVENSNIAVADGNFDIYLSGGENQVILGSGDNKVHAKGGENTIISGTGNDKIYSDKGENNFVFDADFGDDVIYNSDKLDMITLGSAFDHTDMSFFRRGSDLIITDDFDLPQNRITLSKYFKSKSKLDDITHNNVVEKISDQLIYYSGKGRIKGTNFNDAIVGSVKKDTIYSYAGNDYILGGELNDKIYSGAGANKIVVNNGDGHDVLYVDKKATSNTIMFDEGNEVTYVKSGKDLVLTGKVAGASDKDKNNVGMTVKNYFDKSGDVAINSGLNLQYVGSVEVKTIAEELSANGVNIVGKLNKSNKLVGAEDYDNYIIGGNKSDKIYAGDMNNRIEGGKGSDKYYVDSENKTAVTKIFDTEGNDSYIINGLDTSVYIDDMSGKKDVLKITDKVDYTMFFDVSVKEGVDQYNSLFIVDNANIKDESYTSYVADGIEIGNFFDGIGYGDGRIEKITVGGKSVDTSLVHFDEIRSNVASWLTDESHSFDSAMIAFKEGTESEIQSLIAVYQGNTVNA